MDMKKKKNCKHTNTEHETCDVCGHTMEYCFHCEKARCSAETKSGKIIKWQKIY